MLTKAPSDFCKILACGNETITSGAGGEDLAAFVDVTGYEYVLVLATLSVVTGATAFAVQFRESAASSGSSPSTTNDSGGSPLVATIATPAVGTSIALQVRTHGLKQFGSPHFISTGGTSADVAFVVLGINPKDTKQVTSHWTNESSAAVTETATS